jgi:hypothetical protein
MKEKIYNYRKQIDVIIKIEEVETEYGIEYTGDAYTHKPGVQVGDQITEVDWIWKTEEEAIKAIQGLVDRNEKYYP